MLQTTYSLKSRDWLPRTSGITKLLVGLCVWVLGADQAI